jgi:hypothetical protein
MTEIAVSYGYVKTLNLYIHFKNNSFYQTTCLDFKKHITTIWRADNWRAKQTPKASQEKTNAALYCSLVPLALYIDISTSAYNMKAFNPIQ